MEEGGARGANPKRGGGIHLVIWEEITKAKSKKGLGFRCMEDMNEAFLTKLGWSKSRCERKARNTSTTLMDWLSWNINKITKVVMGLRRKILCNNMVDLKMGKGTCLQSEGGPNLGSFSKYLGTCSAFEAETWGVLTGIKMAKELGAGKVILESDAQEVISALRLKKETWETRTIC
nr:nucleic acid binding protein [Ipomoea batatas]